MLSSTAAAAPHQVTARSVLRSCADRSMNQAATKATPAPINSGAHAASECQSPRDVAASAVRSAVPTAPNAAMSARPVRCGLANTALSVQPKAASSTIG